MANKLSRKERKINADKKRDAYYLNIATHAAKLAEQEQFNSKTFPKDLDFFIHHLIKSNPLDAHMIRDAGRKYARNFVNGLKEKIWLKNA